MCVHMQAGAATCHIYMFNFFDADGVGSVTDKKMWRSSTDLGHNWEETEKSVTCHLNLPI